MILLLFIVSYDSLPPLPDLSQIIFPEPTLWLERAENSLLLSGYVGNFYGGQAEFSMQRLNLSGFFERAIDWDTLKTGTAEASYSVPLSHVWVRSKLYGYFLERNVRYILLSPQLDFSSTLPWAVLLGNVRTDMWYINGTHYKEEETELEIIFDRMRYLPHFRLSGIYTDNQLKPMFSGTLHLRNFHLEIGSPIFYDHPSPRFLLQYLDPKIKIETEIKYGTIFSTLKDFFDPEIPLKYRIPVAGESLKLGLSLNFALDFFKHYCGILAAYKNWNSRLVPKKDFDINTAHNIQEVNLGLELKNQLGNSESTKIQNILYLSYNWIDTTIAFLPRYSIIDTLGIYLKPLHISVEAKYLSKRDGLESELAPVVLISQTIGFRYRFWEIFVRIFNMTDERDEILDDYFLRERQYAAGLAFNMTY